MMVIPDLQVPKDPQDLLDRKGLKEIPERKDKKV